MTRATLALVLTALAAPSFAGQGAKPQEPTVTAPEDLRKDVDAWHARRIDRLKAEDGWLSLVGLHWLEEGENPAGSGKDAKVELPASAPALLGTYTRRGKEVSFAPAKGAQISIDGKPFAGGAIKTDASGKADVLRAESLQLLVIERGDKLGVRVRDSEAKTRKSFHGIARFPVSADWRKQAQFIPAKPGESIPIPNVLGTVEDAPLAGTAVFTHHGQEHRLVATQEGDSLFFVFGDETNRTDTYGAGRFLYSKLPKDGKVVLDFNRAYNPPCAFTAYATCPLPPKGNKLKVRIEAGEKRYAEH